MSSLRIGLALMLTYAATLPASGQDKPGKKPEVIKSNKDTPGESIFVGRLIDAECQGSEKCRVSAQTKAYGLILPDNTFLKFDEGGNEKVKEFLEKSNQGRKLLSAPDDAAKQMTVKASGIRTGDTFNLESIQ